MVFQCHRARLYTHPVMAVRCHREFYPSEVMAVQRPPQRLRLRVMAMRLHYKGYCWGNMLVQCHRVVSLGGSWRLRAPP